MKINKGSMCFMSILLIFYLLLPTNVIADGQWKGDNFDSYPLGSLAPPTNGWQSLNNRTWSIATGGVTGNALFFAPNFRDLFVHPSDASDYEISVQIQHSLIPNISRTAGPVVRCSDDFLFMALISTPIFKVLSIPLI